MRYRDKRITQNAIATLETAGILTVMAVVAFAAFGLMDLFSKTFSVRQVTDSVLSSYTQSVLKNTIDLNGDSEILADEALVRSNLLNEVAQGQNQLKQKLNDLAEDSEYRIETEIRIAAIDAISGKFIGFTDQIFKDERGSLVVPDGINAKNSIEEAFLQLASQSAADGSSFLAEPSPDKGYPQSQWNYLPQAAVSGMRITVHEKNAPVFYTVLFDSDGSYIADKKVLILRGGLR